MKQLGDISPGFFSQIVPETHVLCTHDQILHDPFPEVVHQCHPINLSLSVPLHAIDLQHVSSLIRQCKGIERICSSLFEHTETTFHALLLARRSKRPATMSMMVHFSQW